jgi:hypothetical protein
MKFNTSDLEKALTDRESRFVEAMSKAGELKLSDNEDNPEYRLALKRRKAASYIREALRNEGLGDLNKLTRIERVSEES